MSLILLAQTTDFLHYHGLTHAGFLFSAHGTRMIYFFASGHEKEFFSDTNMCAGYFFSKSPTPPPPPPSQKLNGPPLKICKKHATIFV